MSFDFEVIDKKTNIYVVYAGRQRKYLQDFLINNRVYLDLPLSGVDINIASSRENARRAARGAHAIKRRLNGDKDFEIPPSLADLSGDPIKAPKHLNQLVGSIVKLFANAKVGDLIVTPDAGMYGTVYFGRIDAPFHPDDRLVLNEYDGYSAPYRRVRWLRSDVEKRALPKDIVKYVQKPPAVGKVKVDEITSKFFDFAFYSYIYGDISRIIFDAPNYTGRDFYELDSSITLIQFLLASYSMDSESFVAALMRASSIDQFVSLHRGREGVLRASMEFHSPGWFDVKRRSAAFALFAAIILSSSSDKWIETADRFVSEAALEGGEAHAAASAARDRVEAFSRVLPREFSLELDDLREEAESEVGLRASVHRGPK